MCTSTSTSRHWPFFTSFRASSGSDVEIASYPISAITAANISSCAGSSSRIQGVSADFGATISTVLVDTNPTMPHLLAPYLPFLTPPSHPFPELFHHYPAPHHPIHTPSF